MGQSQMKFQELLRELFQFNCADLDFGIYRIMNYKRDVIERFISQDLPKAIAKELDQGALAGQTQAAKELEAAKKKVLEISDDAIDAAGNLTKYHDTKPGKEYLAALEKAKSAKGLEALEAAIYNHLYAFFSRYWQEGDFISKRRYSKRERYAIPYNGEEVTLYWANHDQYYIKTGEYFTDYTWKAANLTVHFKLMAADVAQNNVKGEKRFFLPKLDEITWHEATQSLSMPFEFRMLTGQEAITYGGKNQQEMIIAKTVENIFKKRAVKSIPAVLAALAAEKRRTKDGESVSCLEHHLRQYTRRNTSDFFIHKDLRSFLSRELDFYLKNEVLNLEEMETAGVGLSEGWFQVMRLVKKVGGNIIEFLAQIEELQKMLWEKRKFITETFYCITVGNIPEEFYPEIAACEAQWKEWKELFTIDEKGTGKGKKDRRMDLLKEHPTLVLDTRCFSPEFTDRLLAIFDNLDEATDGLLVHSENWQALNLLTEKYREQIKCIYIDPPYNMGNDGFLYRDSYQHSCWLAMMANRLPTGLKMLTPDGIHLVSIGKDEFDRLSIMLRYLFETQLIPFTWKSRAKPTNAGDAIYKPQIVAEFVLTNFNSSTRFYPLSSGVDRTYPNKDKHGDYRTTTILTSNRGRYRRETMRFEIAGYTPPSEKRWKAGEDEIRQLYESHRIGFGEDGEPYRKIYMGDEEDLHAPLWTFLPEEMTGTAESGKSDLSNVLGKDHGLDSVKPKELLQIFMCAVIEKSGIILDFFAGSGTTGHAAINLNRDDGGRRKFILVEMAQYFDTLLLPRIKKVTFSPEWKDGKPKRMATQEEAERSPRIVKVIRLESYEDALNSIAFDDHSGQQPMQFEDYLLQYMLHWETRKSETMLNVGQLAKPFSYQLRIHRHGETRAQAVDLPETFAYLLGLQVQQRQVLTDSERRYLVYGGVTREGRKTAVIWRETEGWTADDYKRDKEFMNAHKLAEGMDDVYVNGDSYITGARALEPLFKARLFTTVEA